MPKEGLLNLTELIKSETFGISEWLFDCCRSYALARAVELFWYKILDKRTRDEGDNKLVSLS